MVNFLENFCVVKICQFIDIQLLILSNWKTLNGYHVLMLSKSVYLFNFSCIMWKTSEGSVNVKNNLEKRYTLCFFV